MLPFSKTDLLLAVKNGDVTARPHPTLPYTIYNYSPDVQYSNKWNDVTLNCRGLILDDDFNIVARPWKKFFNLGQVNLPMQFDDPVEIMDKVDGSLGILYPWGDGYAIATRGSFESEQAHRATIIWQSKYQDRLLSYDTGLGSKFIQDYTFLFEIIYPANRIVLDYGDQEDLVLLGAVKKSTGHYIGPRAAAAILIWDGPVVEVMPYNTLSDALGHMDRPNAEGFVIRSHNFLVKCKQPDYLELHRLVTNASPKTVWEQLRAGKSKSEIISVFPDEFHNYIGSMIDPLIAAYESRVQQILGDWSMVVARLEDKFAPDKPERKDYAAAFTKSQDARYYFLLLDGKPIRDVLWTELRPRESVLDKVAP